MNRYYKELIKKYNKSDKSDIDRLWEIDKAMAMSRRFENPMEHYNLEIQIKYKKGILSGFELFNFNKDDIYEVNRLKESIYIRF